MLNLAFLPATEPGDETCGAIPQAIAAYPDAAVRQVRYPHMVWYNQAIRKEAIAQIRAWDVAPVVLIGFSKSGLGAWNIAREIPDLVSATIIFDAPVAREQRPPWGTEAFYAGDAEWQQDLPVLTVRDFAGAVPAAHPLILIGGSSFHEQTHTLAQALSRIGREHVCLDCPDLKHHWNSGWIEAGLNALRHWRRQ